MDFMEVDQFLRIYIHFLVTNFEIKLNYIIIQPFFEVLLLLFPDSPFSVSLIRDSRIRLDYLWVNGA